MHLVAAGTEALKPTSANDAQMWGTTVIALSFSAEPEAKAGAEIRFQRRIAGDLLVAAVQNVVHVRVGGNEAVHSEPCAHVHQCVPGRVIHRRNGAKEKVGICAATNEAAIQCASPAVPEVVQRHGSGVFRTA